MKKILVTGANGQLGSQLRKLSKSYPQIDFFFTDVLELDITSEVQVAKILEDFKPNWLINCAAYTAVDKSESDAESAKLINTVAPALLARLCESAHCRMIHISTDYVFDGRAYQPYTEDNVKNPQSVYGHTKSDGEDLVLANNPRSIIIRTSWLYSAYGSNFMKTVLRLATEKGNMRIVSDQIGTPTWAGDLASAVLVMIEKELLPGIYHFSNEGVCSWYDFAKAIIEITGINSKVDPIPTAEYPLPAPRPFYSVLDKALYKSTTGQQIPYWRDSLKQCLKELNE